MISINNPKYIMSADDMRNIVGGKKVLLGTYYVYKYCENGDPNCLELDYTIKKYEIVDRKGNSKNRWVDEKD